MIIEKEETRKKKREQERERDTHTEVKAKRSIFSPSTTNLNRPFFVKKKESIYIMCNR